MGKVIEIKSRVQNIGDVPVINQEANVAYIGILCNAAISALIEADIDSATEYLMEMNSEIYPDLSTESSI